ncbi:16188_t:CDS:2, partial [Racocetra persica]
MVEKEIINISIKLFWDDNSSATFNGPLEFTTTLNHGCTTIKNLDVPSTVLLNGKSYQRIADEPIHSDIHDLLNNVSLEENSRPEAMAQTNYVEHTEKNQVSSQGQSAVSLDRYNEQIDSQDNQHTYVEIANASSNQYPIVLIPSDNIEANTAQQSEDNRKSISKFFKATKRNKAVNFRENIHKNQEAHPQIDDSENKIIDDNSESSKVNEQPSEIQVEADDQQEQSDDSLLPKKNSKPLRVNKP